MSMGPGRADSPFQQLRREGCGLPHGFLTGGQVVEHRGVGAGELLAPVLAWFEEATRTPAGRGALTDAQLLAGVAGRHPCFSVVMLHLFLWWVPLEGGLAPSQTLCAMCATEATSPPGPLGFAPMVSSSLSRIASVGWRCVQSAYAMCADLAGETGG
jgi:hypothetical protein